MGKHCRTPNVAELWGAAPVPLGADAIESCRVCWGVAMVGALRNCNSRLF